MNELAVIIGVFVGGPILAATCLGRNEWQAWRRGRAAMRRRMS